MSVDAVGSDSSSPVVRHGLGPALLWACYLGCSWTWVIGMFLPIMLLRDFGVWGWVAFAVPNVVGAAAMGVVLRRPETSLALVREHGWAMRWFAGVTIAYQVYVVFWLFGGFWLTLVFLLPWLVMDPVRRRAVGGWLPTIAVGVAVLSWGAFSMAAQLEGAWLDVGFGSGNVLPERLTGAELAWLVPGLMGGFLLCPYLDPTFQRARYSTGPGTGAAAFILGFGVVFASMIVFSLMYAGLLRPLVSGGDTAWISSPWRVLLTIHIGLQVGFTLLAHGRERFGGDPGEPQSGWVRGNPEGPWPILWFALIIAASLTWVLLDRVTGWRLDNGQGLGTGQGLTLGEAGYRAFLLVYGVFFPAYVLICMLPTLRRGISPRRKRTVFWIASLIGYPLGVMGLILGPMSWLVGLYAVLVLGRVAVELLPASRTPDAGHRVPAPPAPPHARPPAAAAGEPAHGHTAG